MSLIELFILAVGLSMDAFAVSICKGLSLPVLKPRHAAITGLYFGGFQALMPLVGYLLGTQFQQFITNVDHWIAFALLVFIGGNMIRESRFEPEELNSQFGPAAMLPLAVDIVPAVSFIGVITFCLSAVGVAIGHRFGARYKSRAELAGGIVLALMGCKILLEHLSLLAF